MKNLYKLSKYSLLLLAAPVSSDDVSNEIVAEEKHHQVSFEKYTMRISSAVSFVLDTDALNDGYYLITWIGLDNEIECYEVSPSYIHEESVKSLLNRTPKHNKKVYVSYDNNEYKINIEDYSSLYPFQGDWIEGSFRFFEVNNLPKIEEFTSDSHYANKIKLSDGSYFYKSERDAQLSDWKIGDPILVSVNPDSILLINFDYDDSLMTRELGKPKGCCYFELP